MKFPEVLLAGCFLFVFFAFLLFFRLGEEFIPTLDERDLAIHAVRIPSTSLTQSTKMQLEVEKTLATFSEVAFVFSKTGTAEMASDPMPPNVSDTFVILKPQHEWLSPKLTKQELIDQIEHALYQLPGNNYEFTQPIEMRFNELIAGVRSDVAVFIYGDQFDLLEKTAENIARALKKIRGATDVKTAQTEGLPTLEIKIDREASQRFGVTLSTLFGTLSQAVGGEKAGTLFEGDRRYDIYVRLPAVVRENPIALGSLPIPLPQIDGKAPDNNRAFSAIPLREIASINSTERLNEISRQNGKRVTVVQANVRGTDLGSFVAEAKRKIASEVKIPPGYWIEWGGKFENLISARKQLTFIIPICFVLILLLLYRALQSMKEALIVFSGVPMALSGGVIALVLFDTPFSLSAAVGFIALSGISVLNGLVLLSAINQLMRENISLEAAILQGVMNRLRPVLMTACVASLGFIPMALATGTGAEVQKPLALVVIGGLISSTLLTLFVLPVLCGIILKKEALLSDKKIDLMHN